MSVLASLDSLIKAMLQLRLLRPCLPTITLGVALAVPCIVQAQDIRFDIPSQPLSSALQAFGQQAGIQVLYSADDARGLTSHAVHGSMSPEAALQTMLRGTDISYSLQGNRATIAKRSSDVTTLGPLEINARRLGETTEGTGSYTTGAVTLGKAPKSLKEYPQSVSVVTRQRMDDQGMETIDQALAQTTGITVQSYGAGARRYFSRGRDVEHAMVDGVSIYNWQPSPSGANREENLAIYDRVEVLRGASGMLTGAGKPSATINYVRKHAGPEAKTSIIVRGGTWDNYSTELDVSSPLNSEGTVRGRTVVSYGDRGYFYDDTRTNSQLLYGVLDLDLSPDTLASVGFKYQKVDVNAPFVRGLNRYSDGTSINYKRSTNLTTESSYWNTEDWLAFGSIEHKLNENWKLNSGLNMMKWEVEDNYAVVRGAINRATGTGARVLNYRNVDASYYEIDWDINAVGNFDLFDLPSTLVVGTNSTRFRYNQMLGNSVYVNSVDSLNFDHNLYDGAKFANVPLSRQSNTIDQDALYGTLDVHLTDRLTVTGGARVSWYDYEAQTGNAEPTTGNQVREVTPYAAVTYDLTENWTTYASYTNIFEPQIGSESVGGSQIDPIIGNNYEIGLKGELFDQRLFTSIALFRVDEEHRALEDPINTSCSFGVCYVDSGKTRSQGIELEVDGEVLPNFNLYAGYTFNKTEYLKNNDIEEGQSYNFLQPRHLFKIWGNYQLQGPLERWSVGAGANAQSKISTDSSDIVRQGGYTIFSARVGYKIDDHWTASINGNNLTDKEYFTAIGMVDGNRYGDPRNFMLTLRGTY